MQDENDGYQFQKETPLCPDEKEKSIRDEHFHSVINREYTTTGKLVLAIILDSPPATAAGDLN